MANGFNFFKTNDDEILKATLLGDDSEYLKSVTLGDIRLQVNKFTNLGEVTGFSVYYDGDASAIDGYTIIDGKPYAIAEDGDAYVLLVADSAESDSTSEDLIDLYVCGGKMAATASGIALFSSNLGSISDYGTFLLGTKKLKYAIIDDKNVLIVKGLV